VLITRPRRALKRLLLTFAFLFAAWPLFAASLSAYTLALGAVVAALLAALTFRVADDDRPTEPLRLIMVPLALLYLPYTIVRIYAASFGLLLRLARGGVTPGVVEFHTSLGSDLARTTLCYSITLTPGTIAILADGDHLVVHSLAALPDTPAGDREAVVGPLERFLGRAWS